MKIIKIAAWWLFIFSMPVLLITTSVRIAANSTELYRYGFNKFDISQVTGLSPAELDKTAAGLISYFNSSQKYIDLTVIKDGKPFTLFNEREVAHLKDVKGLFRLVYWLLIGTLVYAVAYAALNFTVWKDRRQVAWGLVGGSGLTLALLIVLGVIIATNFDQFFYDFHLISFSNNLWQLDPSTDYLIMLFPQGFWYDAALFCMLGAAALALLLGGTGWWRLRQKKAADK
jgi:integral membrane protein (TIGR01906 family)